MGRGGGGGKEEEEGRWRIGRGGGGGFREKEDRHWLEFGRMVREGVLQCGR